MGVRINALTATTTPADTDVAPLDTSAGTRKVTWANIKATLKTYFDTLYPSLSAATPVAWTPTFTGFGTVSAVSARSWRVGSELFFEIVFTSGTPTATEARISLGFNGTDGNVTSASTYPTLQHIGSGSSASAFGVYCILAEASKTYITIGFAASSSGGLSKQLANVISASGWVISLKGSARIQGW